MGFFKFDTVLTLPLKPIVLSWLFMCMIYDLLDVGTFMTNSNVLEDFIDVSERIIRRTLEDQGNPEASKISHRIAELGKCLIIYAVISSALNVTAIFFALYGIFKKKSSFMLPYLVFNGCALVASTIIAVIGAPIYLAITCTVNCSYGFIGVYVIMICTLMLFAIYLDFLIHLNYYRQLKEEKVNSEKYKTLA